MLEIHFIPKYKLININFVNFLIGIVNIYILIRLMLKETQHGVLCGCFTDPTWISGGIVTYDTRKGDKPEIQKEHKLGACFKKLLW